MKTMIKNIILLSSMFIVYACADDNSTLTNDGDSGANDIDMTSNPGGNDTNFDAIFNSTLDINNLANYQNQPIPNYINEDNTGVNDINDETATLGRVLFYDTQLSADNSVSCASCHKQELAFGDNEALSQGVNGLTGRHSMRLVNARFADESRFFWDERARNLEEQTTMPIQDHAEMGFSGQNGDPDLNDLIQRLGGIDYYNDLFSLAYGDSNITEERMQLALAQFIRSIQSFDSRYDAGRSQVNNNNQNFPNFTTEENLGKRLYMQGADFQGNSGNRIGGGLGCQSCHNAPEFDIDDNSRNNGVIGVAGDPTGRDLTVTRSPSLRDLFNQNGQLNGQLMHTGGFTNIDLVINHYNDIDAAGNNNLDNRLRRGGGQNLNITQQERDALIAFLRTLTGNDMYTNDKWSNPFQN